LTLSVVDIRFCAPNVTAVLGAMSVKDAGFTAVGIPPLIQIGSAGKADLSSGDGCATRKIEIVSRDCQFSILGKGSKVGNSRGKGGLTNDSEG
jgi:hypothetical protein